MGNSKYSRREFIVGSSAAAAASSTLLSRSQMGGDPLRVGFIGVGNRGSQLLQSFLSFPEVEVAAICDVYEPFLLRDRSLVSPVLLQELGGRVPPMEEDLDSSVQRFKDYRDLLAVPEIDAVVIATPDHWHALQTIAACEAGKDVYVEKPLTITIEEGRAIVQAAERTGRMVQVGLQRRSSETYQRLRRRVVAGDFGEITTASAYRVSNMTPDGIGQCPEESPPRELDWDFWLGPRAMRPYRRNIHPYRFRWWSDFSSQVGNWGVHYFDVIRWMLQEEAPVAVTAQGGNFAVEDDRTIPDTLEVTFQFASGALLTFGQYEASGGRALPEGELVLRGTLGNVYADSRGFTIEPSRGGQFQSGDPRMEAEVVETDEGDSTRAHVANFIESVRSGRPCPCPPREGHLSTVFAHLANIAYETGTRVLWSPKEERIVEPAAANDRLHYEYRSPWKLQG